jgi:hypothetical protein
MDVSFLLPENPFQDRTLLKSFRSPTSNQAKEAATRVLALLQQANGGNELTERWTEEVGNVLFLGGNRDKALEMGTPTEEDLIAMLSGYFCSNPLIHLTASGKRPAQILFNMVRERMKVEPNDFHEFMQQKVLVRECDESDWECPSLDVDIPFVREYVSDVAETASLRTHSPRPRRSGAQKRMSGDAVNSMSSLEASLTRILMGEKRHHLGLPPVVFWFCVVVWVIYVTFNFIVDILLGRRPHDRKAEK